MYTIAEIAQAHEGSLGLALSYIDALAETGVSAVKFQVHIAEAESSKYEPFRIKFSKQDLTRFDYWKRTGFSLQEWQLLKKRCEERGVDFLASPFSNAAVDLLEELKVTRYKIGSGEVNNFLLLQRIANTGKPVILSSGLSSFKELDETVSFLTKRHVPFSLLQCTTAYPTLPEDYGLNILEEFKNRYGVQIGYSDHSGRIETCIAAATLGAEILEFHAVFDRRMFGPDTSSSLEVNEIKTLVKALSNIEKSLKTPLEKVNTKALQELKNVFEKSLAVNKDLSKGHRLKFEDLEAKKPKGSGIDAAMFEKVLDRKLKKNLKQWDFLKAEDLFAEDQSETS